MASPTRKAVAGMLIGSALAMGAPAGMAGCPEGPERGPTPGRNCDPASVSDFSEYQVSFPFRPAGRFSAGSQGLSLEQMDWKSWHREATGGYLLLRKQAGEKEERASATFGTKPYHYVLMGLMVEGLMALNAYLATLDPDVYGGFAVAMAPVAGFTCESCNKPEAIAGSIALAGMGAYNLTLDEDRLSDGDIFRKNFVAWQVAGAAVGITSLVASRHSGKKKGEGEENGKCGGSLRLSPVPGGVGLRCRFRR